MDPQASGAQRRGSVLRSLSFKLKLGERHSVSGASTTSGRKKFSHAALYQDTMVLKRISGVLASAFGVTEEMELAVRRRDVLNTLWAEVLIMAETSLDQPSDEKGKRRDEPLESSSLMASGAGGSSTTILNLSANWATSNGSLLSSANREAGESLNEIPMAVLSDRSEKLRQTVKFDDLLMIIAYNMIDWQLYLQ
jgi:hypothetical protein